MITLLPILSLLACFGNGGGKGADFELVNENNYNYVADIQPQEVPLTLAEDFTIDWSQLTTDLLGHEMDTSEVNWVYFIWFKNLDHATFVDQLNEDEISQVDVEYGAYGPVTGTSVLASTLEVPVDNPFLPEKYFNSMGGTYMVRAVTGDANGNGPTRQIVLVNPTEDAGYHQVDLTPTSSSLDFSVDLGSLTQITVPADSAGTVSWPTLDMDGRGNPIDWNDTSEMWLAQYSGLTVDDLEAQFLDVELIYDNVWTANIYGADDYALGELIDETGAQFTGFAAGSTYLLAMRCPLCVSPAPPFLTVINVE